LKPPFKTPVNSEANRRILGGNRSGPISQQLVGRASSRAEIRTFPIWFPVREDGLAATLILAFVSAAAAAETNSDSTASSPNSILFDRDVRPIFEQNCFQCHGPEKPKSGFHLNNRADALKGGDDNRNDIVPGRSDQSRLIAYVAGLDKDIRMPPPGHGPPLTPAQVGTLRNWIDQGADWGTNSAPPLFTFSFEPVSSLIGVSGDSKKFRELEGVQEGWSGGANHFSFGEQLAPDEKLTVEGHALVPQHDFKVTLALDKGDSGFVHSGFEEWRQYYDDTGGYYPPFTPPSFSLDQSLHLDIGRAWIDFGLTLPDAPQLVFGYEYQFRQGEKSTLVWGTVNQGALSKNIYPNLENVDERTHVFKVDLTREWNDWSLEDRVRAEFYRLSDQRNDVIGYSTGPNPDLIQRMNEGIQYSQGANTFRVQKQIYDWWQASLGSLVSVYNGTSSFNENTMDGSGAQASGNAWQADGITLQRNSYIVSGSSLFLPVKGLSISASAQGEWTHENGFGSVNLAFYDATIPGFIPAPGTENANLDRTVSSENLDIRFNRVPRTVFFAEGRLSQENIGQSADQNTAGVSPYDFQQKTDAMNNFYDGRAGFTSSPWPWLEWGGHYRYRDSNTGYNHLVDTSPFGGLGYPAFITHRDITSDEIEGRLVLCPVRWLNARLTWQWTEADYSTTTEPVSFGISPGGTIADGSTTANNAGLSLNFTPGQRFFFSSSFTYGYSRTTTAGDQNAAVVPYRGDTYTVGASAGWALNAKTRLNATYNFSEAGYGQNDLAGLPLGIDFTRHELLVGLTRQFSNRLSGALHYRFSQYAEPSGGNVNNFTAHGIFASVNYQWP
jgi:mono/diheme cytochrome c family protein